MELRIIGTSHIAVESIREIKKAFEEERPDIVAVELDEARALALLQEQKGKASLADIRKIGVKGFLFMKIGQYIQQKLGKSIGVIPGAEMKTAMQLARQNNLSVALIDQPLKVTLGNFSRRLSWKEKFRFLSDLLQGLFFSRRQMKKLGVENLDLQKVPQKEVIKKMMEYLRQRYPNVYQTLVEDRNKYMVRKLVRLMRENPGKKILVVVGAGHKEGMEELLNKIEVVQ